MHEHRLQAVGVRGPELVAGALGHAQHQRDGDLAAEHVVDVRGVVDDLVEGEQGEVDRHQLDDGAQAGHGGADAHADDRVLGDRRVAYALLAELVEQAGGHLERAPEHADVLAHQEHALVSLQLLAQRGVERVAVAHLGHQDASSPRRTASLICRGISPAWEASSSWAGMWSWSVVCTEYQPGTSWSST